MFSRNKIGKIMRIRIQEFRDCIIPCSCFSALYVAGRTKTAESTFSTGSGTDITDTTQLLQKRQRVSIGPTSTIPTINLSYSPEDETPTDTFNIAEIPAMECDNQDLGLLQIDKSPQLVRKRPSYRRAIDEGLEDKPENKINLHRTRQHQRVRRKSIFSGKNVKYQWYFVVDVIDTMTFIVYVIVMFLGILGVLVVVPLFA